MILASLFKLEVSSGLLTLTEAYEQSLFVFKQILVFVFVSVFISIDCICFIDVFVFMSVLYSLSWPVSSSFLPVSTGFLRWLVGGALR